VHGQPVAITMDTDGKVRIWSLRTGAAIGELIQGDRVFAVCATTVNGDSLAITASKYNDLLVWDLASLKAIDMLTGDGLYVERARAVATTSLNGQPLAVTANDDGVLLLFDLSSRTAIGQLDEHQGAPLNAICATSVNGDPVAITVGKDRAVRVWDLASRTQIGELVGHTDAVRAVSASTKNGKPLAISAGLDGPPQAWDLSSHSAIGRLFGDSGGRRANAVCTTTENNKPLALIAYGTDVEIWDLSSHTQIGQLSGHQPVENIATATVDGQTVVVTAGIEDKVRIWDLTTRAEIGQLKAAGSTSWVEALTAATVSDNPLAITASNDRTVRIWDLRSRTEIDSLVGHPDGVKAVAITSVNGQPLVITGDHDGIVRIWNFSSRTEIGRFLGDSRGVAAVTTATVDNKPLAISAGYDGIIRIFDLNASKQMHSFAAHRGPINDLQAYESVDGDQWLLSVGEDGLLRNWLLNQMLKPHSLGIDDIFAGENTGAEDQLARSELVTHLVKRLDQLTTGDRSPSPLAGDMTGSGIIHVDGRWGAGKTTFVELVLRAGWTGKARPVIVRYDAWRQAAIAPEWWSLASEIRRAVYATRAVPTRWVMTVAGFIRRLALSTSTWVALLSVGALVLVGPWLVSNPGVPQQLDAVLKLLTNIAGVLAIVFVVTRALFWAAPVLGRLHARTDDNPLGEISGIVGHLRRWSPREGVNQRIADWLLAGWMAFGVCLAVWWRPLVGASQHAVAYWHGMPATAQTAAVKVVIALSIAVGGLVLFRIVWHVASLPGKSGTKHQRHKRRKIAAAVLGWLRSAHSNEFVPPPRLDRSDVILLIARIVRLLLLGVIGWLVWPALAAGIRRLWALPVDDRWRWIWALVTVAGLGGYLVYLLVNRNRPRRMVLLIIDDLDRCAADRVVRLLEAIHTLLRERAAPRRFPVWRQPAKFGVLVLANGAWIRASFRSGYKDFDHGGDDAVHDLGADFLQKIFDHSVLVPDLSPEQTHDLMHVVAKSSYWTPATRAAEPRDNGQENPLAAKVLPGSAPGHKRILPDVAPQQDGTIAEKEAPEGQQSPSKEQNPPAGTIATGSTSSRPVTAARTKRDEHSAVKDMTEPRRVGVAESDLGVNAALLVTHLLTKYSAILPGNPRLTIRVATAWAMLRAVAQSLNLSIEGEHETDLLVRAAVIWVRFPALVDEILDAAEPPIIDSNTSDCTPRWRRRDVQEVLTTSTGLLKIEDLAAYYGKFFSPEAPSPVAKGK
jgi:WD40 repeat protein